MAAGRRAARRPRRPARAARPHPRRPLERQRPRRRRRSALADRPGRPRRPPRDGPGDAGAVRLRLGGDRSPPTRRCWPLADGREERVGLWQLQPLLVHAILFGGSYGAAAERAAARLPLTRYRRAVARPDGRGARAAGPRRPEARARAVRQRRRVGPRDPPGRRDRLGLAGDARALDLQLGLRRRPRTLCAGAIDELEAHLRGGGVRAWLVWLPGGDRARPRSCSSRAGYVHDGSPRSMALELADLRARRAALAGGRRRCSAATSARSAAINDRAYGLGRRCLGARALTRPPSAPGRSGRSPPLDGEAVACAGAIDVGDDACITAVGDRPGAEGQRPRRPPDPRACSPRPRSAACAPARCRRARPGAPVYERLGFRDVGCTRPLGAARPAASRRLTAAATLPVWT